MESIKTIYRIGAGPSSSHTMGPKKAVEIFSAEFIAQKYKVTLYGSLAATGKGHFTDSAIIEALSPAKVDFEWLPDVFLPFHPNALKIEAYTAADDIIASRVYYSVGGGKVLDESLESKDGQVYAHECMTDILNYVEREGLTFWEYVKMHEPNDTWDYLNDVWIAMQTAVEQGLENDGVLPGELKLRRKAASYWIKAKGYKDSLQNRCLIMSYALAVSEQNASGGTVVTAPTCGGSGVLPGVLYHLKKYHQFSDKNIIQALATAGLFGNMTRRNASISGAEVGCQGEVGTACAMAAAAACQLFGGSPQQIEYAAEMGLEHHLGLTCDPVCGLVQVPCIERNSFAALRALDASMASMMSDGKHIISFDNVLKTMRETGHDMPNIYKETSLGGLAKNGKPAGEMC